MGFLPMAYIDDRHFLCWHHIHQMQGHAFFLPLANTILFLYRIWMLMDDNDDTCMTSHVLHRTLCTSKPKKKIKRIRWRDVLSNIESTIAHSHLLLSWQDPEARRFCIDFWNGWKFGRLVMVLLFHVPRYGLFDMEI